ncbi:MAG: right-handed parallel beta-helix repeat-containing protein [Dokdonella sp.]
MQRENFLFRVVVPSLIGLLLSGSCFAQATRTWVSGVGDDANPCSRTAPCKTFAGAISKTAASGVIDVLDPGGFGGVTITKAITIESIGNVAGVLVSGTNGIIINAAATDTIVLRGLSIEGLNTGLNGVRFLAGGKLTVEDSTIQGFTQYGVDFEPSTAAQLIMRNVTITKSALGGVLVQAAAGGSTNVSMDNVRLLTGKLGVLARSGQISLKNMTISENDTNGISVTGGTQVKMSIDDSLISENAGTGISVFNGNATLTLSRTSVTGNNIGIQALSGAINSFKNNRFFGNTTSDGTPTNQFTEQ